MNIKLRLAISFLGLMLIIASIWLGAYGMHVAPEWAHFPTFSTACISFIIGLLTIITCWIDKVG